MALNTASELANQAWRLKDRFRDTSAVGDILDAVQLAEEAVMCSGDDMETLANSLIVLSSCLEGRFRVRASLEDADAAVEAARRSLALTSGDASAVARHHLANRILGRYRYTANRLDLDEAAELAQDAIERVRDDDPELASVLNTGALCLQHEYRREKTIGRLTQAIDLLQRAVAPQHRAHRDIAYFYSNLSHYLMERYNKEESNVDLIESVRAAEMALGLTSAGALDRPLRVNNLANRLLRLHQLQLDDSALDRAIELVENAVALSLPAVYSTTLHYTLGRALAARGRPGDKRAALQLCQEVVDATPPLERVRVGKLIARTAADVGSTADVLKGWESVIEALRAGLSAEFGLAGKQALLAEARGAASEGAIAAVQAGDPKRAVALLETGRALLLAEALGRNSHALEALSAHGQQELARCWQTEARRLAFLEGERDRGAAVDVQEARRLRERVNGLANTVRELPGLADFGTIAASHEPPPAGTVYAYFAIGADASTCLIVYPDGEIDPVLIGLSAAEVDSRLSSYLDAYQVMRGADPDNERAFATWVDELDSVCHWLWQFIGPVVERVRSDELVVLLPDGRISLLPLHAGWRPEEQTRQWAVDSLTCTYAPTAFAYRQGTGHTIGSQSRNMVIGDPFSERKWPHLESAALEAEQVAELLGCKPSLGRGASTGTVLQQLPAVDGVAHFACHGYSDFADPMASALVLAQDEPLCMRDVRGLELKRPMVVLSACESGMPGRELPDEFVGLPVGLLEAGASSVVASLWQVSDAITAELMVEFYTRVVVQGLVPPAALRAAQRAVRGRLVADASSRRQSEQQGTTVDVSTMPAGQVAHPYWWAAFVHVS